MSQKQHKKNNRQRIDTVTIHPKAKSVAVAAGNIYIDPNQSNYYLITTAEISTKAVDAIRKKIDGKVKSESVYQQ